MNGVYTKTGNEVSWSEGTRAERRTEWEETSWLSGGVADIDRLGAGAEMNLREIDADNHLT